MRFGFRRRKEMPDGLWTKCPGCSEMVYRKEVAEKGSVCPSCDHHFPVSAQERIDRLLDAGSFREWFAELEPTDPLAFVAVTAYRDRLRETQEKTGLKDAIVTGEGRIDETPVAFGCTDARFMMGSMGSVVGEKIARTFEKAADEGLPVVIVSGSGGGARMQESALSLMQMAKVSAAYERFSRRGGFFVSVLTNPTMGGVMASFASLGDVILAEPKALLGFTGPRVIKQTIGQDLPKNFQSSEFMLEHGFVDKIVPRGELKRTIASLLSAFAGAARTN